MFDSPHKLTNKVKVGQIIEDHHYQTLEIILNPSLLSKPCFYLTPVLHWLKKSKGFPNDDTNFHSIIKYYQGLLLRIRFNTNPIENEIEWLAPDLEHILNTILWKSQALTNMAKFHTFYSVGSSAHYACSTALEANSN